MQKKYDLTITAKNSVGVVYNAKGDLTGPTVAEPLLAVGSDVFNGSGGAVSTSVTFNSTGTISGSDYGPTTWVDSTWGLEDAPLWPDPSPDPLSRDWQGGGGYTISWTTPVGGAGSPSPLGSQSLATSRTFSLGISGEGAESADWEVTITNNAPGAAVPSRVWAVSLSVESTQE